ncbi:MAG: ABC transporter ATP-binding protein, partial [Candidatus Methanomethylophilaceae archaeon]|nr:ABC transporter ATP-binding protein [Candidatus Methanomethylophilaceae archaeon]
MSNRIPMMSGSYVIKGVRKDRPESMKESWKFIFAHIKRYKWLFLLAMVMVAVESILTAIAPDYIGKMTDLIDVGLFSGEIDLGAVTGNALIVLFLYLAGTLAMYMRNYWMADISQYVAGEVRKELYSKMENLPMKFFDTCRKGDVMSRFTNDADIIGTALNRSVAVFTHGIILFVVCIFMMLFTDVVLALVSMSSAFGGMAISYVVVQRTQKYYRRQQKNIGGMYSMISEMYSAQDIVLAYSATGQNKERFDEINESLRASGFRSEVTMGLLPAVMKFFGNIGYVAVCIIGSMMVIEGQITIGVVVAFILYVKMFMGPLDMISSSLGNLQAAGAGAERVRDFLTNEEMPEDLKRNGPAEVRGHIEFRDVH